MKTQASARRFLSGSNPRPQLEGRDARLEISRRGTVFVGEAESEYLHAVRLELKSAPDRPSDRRTES
jgi:hypothetical protein